jgi:hypothetical protein
VRVRYDAEGGPDSRRLDLERGIAGELAANGCFAAVRAGSDADAAGAPADLLLDVELAEWQDEQLHDVSIAQRHSPDAMPDTRRGYVARIAARVGLAVETAAGATVRAKKLAVASEYRPVLDENPRAEAVREWTFELVNVVRRFACKGNEAKWRREIAEATGDDRAAR